MSDDTPGESPPRRPPFGLSPAVPRILFLLGLCGIALGLWPLAYWATRDARAVRASAGEGVEVCRVDLAVRAAAIRRFRETHGRLPSSLPECAAGSLTTQDWTEWANRPRRAVGLDLWALALRIEEPWTRDGRYFWGSDSETPGPFPPPDLDLLGLPLFYEPGGDSGSFASRDELPRGVVRFLDEHGGVPAESPESFSLGALGLDHLAGKIRAAGRSASLAVGLLIGGIVLLIAAWFAVDRAWRGHTAGRLGRWFTIGFSIVTGLVVLVGLGATGATCYMSGRFSTRYLSKQKRLQILETAVVEGKVRADVAEQARAYLRELP